jgi:hypothetical protein
LLIRVRALGNGFDERRNLGEEREGEGGREGAGMKEKE